MACRRGCRQKGTSHVGDNRFSFHGGGFYRENMAQWQLFRTPFHHGGRRNRVGMASRCACPAAYSVVRGKGITYDRTGKLRFIHGFCNSLASLSVHKGRLRDKGGVRILRSAEHHCICGIPCLRKG